MIADFQMILITTLLLLAIAEESKGNEGYTGNERTPTGGSCCQSPGDQSDVTITDKENITIECRKKEQGKIISWYSYGSVDFGLGLYSYKTSGTKYTAPSSGGIFICTTEENKTYVKSEHFCNSHKTFIISPAPETRENKDNATTYVEGENVTLGCHVNLSVAYALLWIATYPNGTTKCLSSVEVVKDISSHNIPHNKLCCPTEGIYQRYNETHSLHYLDIHFITTSQSGEYLCDVYIYDKGAYSWKRVNETIVQVTKKDANTHENKDNTTHKEDTHENKDNTTHKEDTHENKDNTPKHEKDNIVYIVSGTIGGLIAIGVILCLAILYIKYKGKQRKVNHSHSNAPTTEYECTPYADSTGQHNNPQTIYAKAKEPMSTTGAEYTEIEVTRLAVCSDAEYSEVGLGPQPEPIPEYSYVGMKPQVEPSSEYSEVGMEPCSVYSKIG